MTERQPIQWNKLIESERLKNENRHADTIPFEDTYPLEQEGFGVTRPPNYEETMPRYDARVGELESTWATLKDKTPQETRQTLRGLIGGAMRGVGRRVEQGIGSTVERVLSMSEQGKKMSEYLHNRSAEIDAEKKIGWLEKSFRGWGEKYDTLGWKSKLAVGLGLGVGAGAAASFSLPTVLGLCLGGVATQRVLGLASTFTRYEKQYQEQKVSGLFSHKDKAMGKAMIQAAAMTGAMNLLAEGARDSIDWIRQHYFSAEVPVHHEVVSSPIHTASAPEVAQTASVPEAVSVAPDVSEPAAAAAAGETVFTPEVPAMPDVSIDASAGHGYEWMMKRIWEQLQERHLDATVFAEGSDIRRLLEADVSTIDKVVHQIAGDPNHGFINPDQSSAIIHVGARLDFASDGTLRVTQKGGIKPVIYFYPCKMK